MPPSLFFYLPQLARTFIFFRFVSTLASDRPNVHDTMTFASPHSVLKNFN